MYALGEVNNRLVFATVSQPTTNFWQCFGSLAHSQTTFMKGKSFSSYMCETIVILLMLGHSELQHSYSYFLTVDVCVCVCP